MRQHLPFRGRTRRAIAPAIGATAARRRWTDPGALRLRHGLHHLRDEGARSPRRGAASITNFSGAELKVRRVVVAHAQQLAPRRVKTSGNPHSSHHGVEKETNMRNAPHCEKSHSRQITMCRQNLTGKRHACFNLALLIKVADPAPNHARRRTHQHRHSTESRTKRDLISTTDTHLLAQTARKTVAAKAQADCTIRHGFITGAMQSSVTKMLFLAHQILSRASAQQGDVRPLAEATQRRGRLEKSDRTSARTMSSAPQLRLVSGLQIEALDCHSSVPGRRSSIENVERIDRRLFLRLAPRLGVQAEPLA